MTGSFSMFAAKPLGRAVDNSWRSFPAPQDSHLETSQRLILAAAADVEPREVLILGAGECLEIPLRLLAERFQSVTLQDLDAPALEIGISNGGLSADHRRRIRLLISDLNGFGPQHVSAVLAGLDRYSAERAAAVLIERLRHLAPAPFVAPRKADLVVASCVMSQLHISFLHAVVERFKAVSRSDGSDLLDSTAWRDAAFDLSEQMEANLVHTLRNNVQETGRVYLAATTHLMEYRITDSGDWQSPGLMRCCRYPTLEHYTEQLFRTERKEQWWWDITATRQRGSRGHGYSVEGAELSIL